MAIVRSTVRAVSKSQLAKDLGVSRASLYYKPKRPAIDEEVKHQIESVLVDHADYGHKRIAIHLRLNKKRILRVMKKFGIKPYRRVSPKPRKKEDEKKPPSNFPNLIQQMLDNNAINRFGLVWGTDFTYLSYKQKFLYLATIIDLWNREIVGVNISRYHNRFLVIGAFLDAVSKFAPAAIIHSDQGSEYDSRDFQQLVGEYGCKISMSKKAHPWENGRQESFYGKFKTYLGQLNRFDNEGELIAEIYRAIYYFNHERIHGKLKMSPVKFRQKFEEKAMESLP